MRNRKLKGNNLQAGMRLRTLGEENIKISLVFFLGLHEVFGISRRRIIELWQEYTENTVPKWKKDCKDGVSDERLARKLFDMKVSAKDIRNAVLAQTSVADVEIIKALCENLSTMCIELNTALGYGHVRIGKLLGYIQGYKGDSVKDAEEILDIVVNLFGQEIPDASLFRTRKEKAITYTESQRLVREMEAVRRIQEGKT